MHCYPTLMRRIPILVVSLFVALSPLVPTEAEEGVLVAWAAPLGADGELRTERFESVAQAAAAASGGRIDLSPTATMKDLVEALKTLDVTAAQDESVPLAFLSTIIGIDWDGSGFSGSSFIWSAPNGSGCAGGSVFTANSMPSGWDNRVSSAQAFGGCGEYRHYDLTAQSGSSTNCTCSSMGFMNDRTSSERWAP